ncbi:hypothetical protein POKO110462_10915 [Pontibacter korlensis]|uniref:Uncharacterized protein n=1 Tax=Pontibacter korlensis TaxID=400092 RepID=A0A0E3ZHR4_9BACT|nr:hypothetical protein [Pontibacter korlensis]AKD04635.1 hypothetical protein PKOR_17960 [Pontibacter korlensis]
MAGLEVDISAEFLKNFIPETVYLVEGEIPVSAPEETSSVPVQPVEVHTELNATSPATVAAPAVPEAPVGKTPAPALPKFPKKEASPLQQKYKITGQNQKGVAILVTLPDDEFAQLPQLQFLQKILSAIGLRPEDVAYVNNVSGSIALFEDLLQHLQVNYIISFASRIDTALPHEKFTLYNPVTVGNIPVVFSQALNMLEHNVEHKKLLWGALQKVFTV